MLVSDENRAIGGHMIEANVFSTAEVVIQELDKQIERKLDNYTGLKELGQYGLF
jgi:predicted DNA-binding protein with PD1-like motif